MFERTVLMKSPARKESRDKANTQSKIKFQKFDRRLLSLFCNIKIGKNNNINIKADTWVIL